MESVQSFDLWSDMWCEILKDGGVDGDAAMSLLLEENSSGFFWVREMDTRLLKAIVRATREV